MIDAASDFSDEEIVKQIKKDKKNFDLMYRKYHQRLFGYVFGYLRNKENVEDLVSEVFEKALKGIDNYQWEGVSLQSWLFRIARNAIIDFYRKKPNKYPHVSLQRIVHSDAQSETTLQDTIEDKEEPIEKQAIRSEEEEHLHSMLKTLSVPDQYLLYYKYFEELSNKEIGKLLGITETNVGTKLQRLRNSLKSKMTHVYENATQKN